MAPKSTNSNPRGGSPEKMGKSEDGIPEVEVANPDGMSDESRWNDESWLNDQPRWNDEPHGMTNSASQKGGVPHTKEGSHLEKEESHV